MQSGPVWQVMYDAASEQPTGLGFVILGLFLVGFALVRLRWHLTAFHDPVDRKRAVRRRGYFLVFAVLWTLLAGISIFRMHSTLTEALRTGTYTVVEGTVEAYRPANVLRKIPERWRVGIHVYEIDPNSSGTGFDHVGIVKPGSTVRIADVKGQIARLEVAQ
jgi:hypothetical protein